jgi:regulator of sigma E protease
VWYDFILNLSILGTNRVTFFHFVLAAIALGILVFIHELGHYLVAKMTGMTVEVFSIGFGKPLIKWRWNNVDWQLGWLPFGGYVKIAGMELGKKENQLRYSEPYEIPNGFFSKSPLKRILVACAGPCANFILALLLFSAVWVMGGREKPFADFTHLVGWVDPHSELYAMGLRPGDEIRSYNGKPYTGSKDLLYAAMLGGKKVELKGFHVDYANHSKSPFAYTIESYPALGTLEGVLTTGMTTGARYLIYDKFPDGSPNPLPEGSPMQDSGIAYQDRLVWANGEYLFSMDQLSHILNSGKTYLTVQRGEETFATLQPRVMASDLVLPPHVKNELIDWHYEMTPLPQMKKRSLDLYLLPYVINNEGYVEAPLEFFDKESKHTAFPLHPYSPAKELPLLAGDRIIAVDGTFVHRGVQILELIQQPRIQLIAETDTPVATKENWKEEDKAFTAAMASGDIEKIAQTIGTQHPLERSGRFVLLKPVKPKPINQFVLSVEAQEELRIALDRQREGIEKMRDNAKRAKALGLFETVQHKLLLGVGLQDRKVDYNPAPWVMFNTVFIETGQTLRALVVGHLNPKWLSGPVGIVQVIQHGWRVGVGEALFWIAAISLNLGFLNLLPIPVLDGGYICLSLWELITRRRLKAKTMERLIIPFVVLLFALLIFLTFQDVTRLFH